MAWRVMVIAGRVCADSAKQDGAFNRHLFVVAAE